MEEAIAAMRALWTEEEASFDGTTASFSHCFLRPQPPGGSIPVHIGGHSRPPPDGPGGSGTASSRWASAPKELPDLVAVIRSSAEEAGRDPAAVEVTMQCTAVSGEEAHSTVKEMEELGVTRMLLPSVLFGAEFEASLARYGDDVIART
jgi:alkanesulfonate monooxygenase SsuD/methylene tetrahydromethanopterin reductase-like flavin-dependent oxidoreductase (luciferase family)